MRIVMMGTGMFAEPTFERLLAAGENVVGIDTGCGSGGFLTCVELPAMNVYESR